MKKSKPASKPRTAQDEAKIIHDAQRAALLARLKAKKPLSAAQMEFLSSEQQKPEGRRAVAATATPDRGEDPRVFLRPADFLRYCEDQGTRISKKTLYKSYFGAGARHPVKTSADGKRIHKFEALELIRLVQAGEAGGDDDSARIIRERQQAEAAYKAGKSQIAMIELETLRGERVRREVVEKVWGEAVEAFRNELRTLEHNLPAELANRTAEDMRTILGQAHHAAMKHLATTFAEKAGAS